jgi:hypothetical protein
MSKYVYIIKHGKVTSGDLFPVIQSLLDRHLNPDEIIKDFWEYNTRVLHMDMESGDDDYTLNQYRVYHIISEIRTVLAGKKSKLTKKVLKLRKYGLWTEHNQRETLGYLDRITFTGSPTDTQIRSLIEYSNCFTVEQYSCLGI